MTPNLQAAAQEYWRISRVWNGQSNERLQTQGALRSLKDLSLAFGPHRTIRQRSTRLLNEMIQGGKPQNKAKQQTQKKA